MEGLPQEGELTGVMQKCVESFYGVARATLISGYISEVCVDLEAQLKRSSESLNTNSPTMDKWRPVLIAELQTNQDVFVRM